MSLPPIAWTAAVTLAPPADVEAGTLLGAGTQRAADHVGDGAIALQRPAGRVEVRASRDGVPSLCADGVTVGRMHELRGDADGAVRGSLRIGGHVPPGRELTATGPVRVDGDIDRSEVWAGGELHVEGRAGGAALVGGSLADLRHRLHGPLGGIAPEIDALVQMAGQLAAAAASRDATITAPQAIRALSDRFARLEPRLAEAEALLASARRAWPGLCAGLAAEVAAAHRAVAEPGALADPLGRLTEAAGFLAAAVPQRRSVTPVGVRLRAATACSISTAGPLRLLGAGAVDCDIDVGGDLVAMGTGGAIRGGTIRAGGRVLVRELAGGEGAPLRLVLDGARSGEEVLRAGVVSPGVEIAVGRETLRFDRKRSEVRVGIREGRPVLLAA